jgi:hypothetical protein
MIALLAALALAPAALPAHVSVTACTHGADPAAAFEARMHAIGRTSRMQMRFTLQARTGESSEWRPVAAPGFGAWLTSERGVARFVYVKRVEQLLAPAAYRAVVRFRWLDAAGRRLASARATSGRCFQPDPRPNLVLRRLLVEPAAAQGERRYVAIVANRGRRASGPFAVDFSVAETPLGRVSAGGLAPGDVARIRLTGPECIAGAEVTAVADHDGAIDERDETDNRLSVPCPPSGA